MNDKNHQDFTELTEIKILDDRVDDIEFKDFFFLFFFFARYRNDSMDERRVDEGRLVKFREARRGLNGVWGCYWVAAT